MILMAVTHVRMLFDMINWEQLSKWHELTPRTHTHMRHTCCEQTAHETCFHGNFGFDANIKYNAFDLHSIRTTFTRQCTHSEWDLFQCIGNERIHFELSHSSTRCISSSNFVITPKPIGCPICAVIYSSFDVWLFWDNYMVKCVARRRRTQNIIRARSTTAFPAEYDFEDSRRRTTAAIGVIKLTTNGADEARCRNTPIDARSMGFNHVKFNFHYSAINEARLIVWRQ